MASIDFILTGAPLEVGVYTIARSITGVSSTMQLRKRVEDGQPLVQWDTDDVPIDLTRSEYYKRICDSVARMTSFACDYQLFYRPSPSDDSEPISLDQLNNLLKSDLDYENQQRD